MEIVHIDSKLNKQAVDLSTLSTGVTLLSEVSSLFVGGSQVSSVVTMKSVIDSGEMQ